MCGRFSLSVTPRTIWELFGLESGPALPPRYNIAPSQQVAALRMEPGGQRRELVLLRWGLVPHWAKDPAMGARMINARAETVAEKPSFRTAFRRRRCLIPADGYYEWRTEEGKKQPYFFRMAGGEPFAFAGLWERWEAGGEGGGGGEGKVVIESAAIITTDCNEIARPVHMRMPAILQPEQYRAWLDPAVQGGAAAQALLGPYSGGGLTVFPVSTHVNKPLNDDPACVAPLLPAAAGGLGRAALTLDKD